MFKRRAFLALYSMSAGLFLILTSLGSPVHAQSNNRFSLEVPETKTDFPIAGEVGIDLAGRHLPQIIVAVGTDGQAIGYDTLELWIDNSRKTHWDGVADTQVLSPSSYTWSMCAGNASPYNGAHTVTLHGKSAVQPDDVLASLTFYTSNIDSATICQAADSSGAPTLTLSTASTTSNPKITTATLTIAGVDASQFCGQNSVVLTVSPPEVNNEKGTFCGPSSPTLQQVSWDSSGSAPGSYTLQAKSANQTSSGSNITSNRAQVTVQSDGSVTNTSGSASPAAGTTNPTTNAPSSVSLGPLTFTVPNLSRLDGKSPADLAGQVINVLLEYILIVVSAFALFAFLYSGVMYGLSFGDAAKAEKAKKNLQWAVYGVIVVILSASLLGMISTLLHAIKSP